MIGTAYPLTAPIHPVNLSLGHGSSIQEVSGGAQTLDGHDLKHVQIVAADETGDRNWQIVEGHRTDPELAAAVEVVGRPLPTVQEPADHQGLRQANLVQRGRAVAG